VQELPKICRKFQEFFHEFCEGETTVLRSTIVLGNPRLILYSVVICGEELQPLRTSDSSELSCR